MSACPICKGSALAYPENRFAPFCSERCKWIDLGQWADGSYRIPDEESAIGLADLDEPMNDRRET